MNHLVVDNYHIFNSYSTNSRRERGKRKLKRTSLVTRRPVEDVQQQQQQHTQCKDLTQPITMDKAQLLKTVESLKFQLHTSRIPMSKACADLKEYCQRNINADPLITPVDKKENPWAEKSKCSII